ncbi:MAG: hypothetical protein JNJ88_13210 [Planctomycetes bacterium]|nr:hypothetical protein [Planctomycetota bacterium]
MKANSSALILAFFLFASCSNQATINAVGQQLAAKKARIESSTTDILRDAENALAELQKASPQMGVDGLLELAKTIRSTAETIDRRGKDTDLLTEDLRGFMKEHDALREDLKLAAMNRELQELSDRRRHALIRFSSASSSIRYSRGSIVARSEWQPLELKVSKGDRLIVSASGEWSVGPGAGSCSASGMDGYDKYSLLDEYKHGALLVAVDQKPAFSGQGSFSLSDSGDVSCRCNDSDYRNNDGALTVGVLAYTMPSR